MEQDGTLAKAREYYPHQWFNLLSVHLRALQLVAYVSRALPELRL